MCTVGAIVAMDGNVKQSFYVVNFGNLAEIVGTVFWISSGWVVLC